MCIICYAPVHEIHTHARAYAHVCAYPGVDMCAVSMQNNANGMVSIADR